MTAATEIAEDIFAKARKDLKKTAKDLVRKGECKFAEAQGFGFYGTFYEYEKEIEFALGEYRCRFEITEPMLNNWIIENRPEYFDDFTFNSLSLSNWVDVLTEFLGNYFYENEKYFSDVPDFIEEYYLDDYARASRR